MNDMPECYIQKRVKARKSHYCHECCGVIRRNEKYYRHSGIWNHEPMRFKVCLNCERLRQSLDQDTIYREEETPFGGLLDSLCEKANAKFVHRYVRYATNRNGILHKWMLEAF